MAALPPPNDLTSLVLRTDFSDDAAWHAIRAAFDDSGDYRWATCVDDPVWAGVTIETSDTFRGFGAG